MKTILILSAALFLTANTAQANDPSGIDADPEPNRPKNFYLSVGLFDHKTGLSIGSFSYNLVNAGDHEVFIGAGTSLIFNASSLGWKYYLFSYGVDFYSVLAVQGLVGGMSKKTNILPATFASLGFEKALTKKLWINAGVNLTVRLYLDGSHPPDILVLPNCNVNWRW